MKFCFILFALLTHSVSLLSQTKPLDKFSLMVYGGKSFLGYGDVWGVDRNISIQYGKKYYISLEYEFADFEGSQFEEEYYANLKNSTLVSKYLNSFSGNSAVKFFGLKSLDVKDNLITINSYNLRAGTNWSFLHKRLKVGIFGVLGLYKLSRIGTDFILSGVDIDNPNFLKQDVTIYGTYTHRFINYSYGFGVEMGYELLPERLQISLFAKAQRGPLVWSTFGIGTRVNI